MPLGTGGAPLGTARGAIILDTSQAEAGAVRIRRVSGEIENSFKGVGTAAQRGMGAAGAAVKKLGSDLQVLRGQAMVVGAAASGFAALGIKAATALETARVKLTFMLQSEQKAVAMMGALKDAAMAAGVPFEDMLRASTLLLPTLEGNTDQLAEYMKLAQRVAVLNPQEGMGGAAFAINEAISSGGTDLVSLSERFQISRFALRDALQETEGDFAEALDIVLDKMGITEEAADAMGQTFVGAMNRFKTAAQSAQAEAFAPLQDGLRELLNNGAEWLTQLQETNPELLHTIGNITALTAGGAGLVLVLTSLVSLLGNPIALAALSPVLGAGLGKGIAAGANKAGLMSDERNAAIQAQSMVDIFKNIAQAGLIVVGAFQLVNKASETWGNDMGTSVAKFVIQMRGVAGELEQWIKNTTGKDVDLGGINPDDVDNYLAGADLTQMVNQQNIDHNAALAANDLLQAQNDFNKWVDSISAFFEGADPYDEHLTNKLTSGRGAAPPLGPPAPTNDELEAFDKFQTDLAEISADAQEDRIAEEAQYQERLTDLNEDYNDAREKITEDAQDRILDLETKTAKQIADVHEDAGEREAKENADSQERIAELQTEYQKDELRRLEDFQREEQRAKRQHNITLLMAAAGLDAKAIWQENLKYNQQRSDAEEDFNVETDQRADQFQERLLQEQESHEERLQEAREADAQRIEDLREHLAEERAEIQADAAEKLAELDMQHAEELTRLAAKHKAELDAINAHEIALTGKRTTAFKAELDGLGDHYDALLGVSQTKQEQLRKDWEAWIDSLGTAIPGSSTSTSGGGVTVGHEDTSPGGLGGYALGGMVNRTGPAMLHEKERVLNPAMTAMLNRMTGSNSDPALISALAGGRSGGGNRSSSVVWNGDMVLPAEAARSPQEMYNAAWQAITDFFSEMAGDD